jgi:hypothetical protein
MPRHRPVRLWPVYLYDAGSLHGPGYDSHSYRIERPVPPVVGTRPPDAKLEQLSHRAAAGRGHEKWRMRAPLSVVP